jgi:hypothetical protein
VLPSLAGNGKHNIVVFTDSVSVFLILAGQEAENSYPASAEVKNTYSYASILLFAFVL